MRSARGLLAIIGAALSNQPTLAPEASVIQHERPHDYGDRTQALIEEWNSMRIAANEAAHFYTHSETPFARKPRPGDPRQMQFHEQTFIDAAEFFLRAGNDIAVGEANPARLSVLGADAYTWLKVLRQQRRGRWDRQRKLLFAQAAEGLRIITNEGGHIRNGCDWQPLVIEGYDHQRRDDEIIIEVRIFNPNDIASPVAAICLMRLLFGALMIKWPDRTSLPARKRTKVKFRLRFVNGELDVRFARSTEIQR